MTAFCILAAAVLFVPSFPAFEREENNVYEIRLNGESAGLTENPEEAEELLAQARAAAVSGSKEMVFMEAELELEGRSMLFGRVDGQETIREKMQSILENSVRRQKKKSTRFSPGTRFPRSRWSTLCPWKT